MSQKRTHPGTDADDPWNALTAANRAASRGANREVGDTSILLRRNDTLEVGQSPSSEILKLVTDSLTAAPERADLWMMRFEILKELGMKTEFAAALVGGWRHPRVGRELDWLAIRRMWEELAPGEPAPEGIRLPEAGPEPVARAAAGPAFPAGQRRFSDLAQQIAAAELDVLAKAYAALRARPDFFQGMARAVAPLLGRPTPLRLAEGLTRVFGGGARIYLKREDLRRVTPETENAAAQAHVASLLGRRAAITGNDVDAHSLALAGMAPRFNLQCTVVLRPADLERKADLVNQLRGLGAAVEAGAGMTRDDPREGALRLWQKSRGQAHLVLSPGAGPRPYPSMSSDFQSLLGRETELQLRALAGTERPRTLVAAVHSEADSIGFVLPQLARPEVELVFAEPDAEGWRPGARLRAYNGAAREHAWLRATGRISHIPISDSQAQAVQRQVSSVENVNVSLEDARALALAALLTQRDKTPRDLVVLVA